MKIKFLKKFLLVFFFLVCLTATRVFDVVHAAEITDGVTGAQLKTA
ncbi:hypothetical protein [Haploplasma axanthum]|nr:hypothetical protein [Haploplasma axanthum]